MMPEESLVRQLLGRQPRLPYVVASRCPKGTPQVLLADPVFFEEGRWKPFPSFLWLVCPRLKNAVAKLEQEGFIQMFAHRLREDRGFREEFLDGHQKMVAQRLELAAKVCASDLSADVKKILETATIAGSRSIFGVKCLHAHLAQTMVGGKNPIGKTIAEKIGPCTADVPCVKKTEGGFGK